MIAKQTGDNCVNRALSTMRLALGYRKGVPEWAKHGEKAPHQILEVVGGWFPKHQVKVSCSQEDRQKVSPLAENCEYLGDYVLNSFDWDSHLVAFTYYIDSKKDITVSHFVIGVPTLYGDMGTSIIVCVEI